MPQPDIGQSWHSHLAAKILEQPQRELFRTSRGWYHYDETYANAYGPFKTQALARTSLDWYSESLGNRDTFDDEPF